MPHVGCINLKGNPTPDQVGIYDIKIATTAYASASLLPIGPPLKLPVADTTEGYKLVIKGDGSASIFENNLSAVNIYPNPFEDFIIIESSLQISELRMYDMQGRLVSQQKENVISTIGLNSGLYTLVIIDGKQKTKTRKIIKL